LQAIQFVIRQTAITYDLSADVFDLDSNAESGAAKLVEQRDLHMYIDNRVIGILYVHRYAKVPHYDAWKILGDCFVSLGRWEVIWTPPTVRGRSLSSAV